MKLLNRVVSRPCRACFSVALVLCVAVTPSTAAEPDEEILYTVELWVGYSHLATVDKATGAVLETFPNQADRLIDGMAFDPSTDTLFGFDPGDGLYTIDRATGAYAAVGSGAGMNIGALAIHPTTFELFGLGVFGGALWQIDKTSGIPTSIDQTPGELGTAHGLAFSADGTLYATDTAGTGLTHLFELDPSTGNATFVSDIDRDHVVSLTFDTSGVLYGSDNGTNSLITIDIDTGTATTVGPYGGLFHNAIEFVPEPGTLSLLIVGAWAVARRRRRGATAVS